MKISEGYPEMINIFQLLTELFIREPSQPETLSYSSANIIQPSSKSAKMYTAKCGHKTPLKLDVVTDDNKIGSVSFKKDNVMWCPDCFSKQCVRCGWCGNPIFPGNGVTLNSPINPNEQFPEYAYLRPKSDKHNKDVQVIGCLGWDCPGCGSGAEIAGHLDSHNNEPYIRLIESPISKAFRTGEVQVSNLQNPSEFESIGTIPLIEFRHPT